MYYGFRAENYIEKENIFKILTFILLYNHRIINKEIMNYTVWEREIKRVGVQPSDEPKSCTPVLCLWKVCETEHFFPHISNTTDIREIIKAPSGKSDTGDYFAVFAPLSPQFFERLEK